MLEPLDAPLDLEATLHSGQSFRWRPPLDGWHEGSIQNRPVRVRVRAGRLEWEGAPGLDASDVRRYFRLDRSHARFLAEVRRDAALEEALGRFPGLRLLRQEPWEMFVAYILSSNSNVGKISRTIESLARRSGERVEWRGDAWYGLPTARALATMDEAELRTTSMGYRAPHLREASRWVAEGRLALDRLAQLPYEEAHGRLVEAPGVGAKVADCVLLYGFGRLEPFPADVWIQRVVRESYFPRKRLNYHALGSWARSHFGPWTGYAQHVLFHYRRVVGPLPRVVVSQASRRRRADASRSRRARATRAAAGNVTES